MLTLLCDLRGRISRVLETFDWARATLDSQIKGLASDVGEFTVRVKSRSAGVLVWAAFEKMEEPR